MKKETSFDTYPTWIMLHKNIMNRAELDRDKLSPFSCFSFHSQ